MSAVGLELTRAMSWQITAKISRPQSVVLFVGVVGPVGVGILPALVIAKVRLPSRSPRSDPRCICQRPRKPERADASQALLQQCGVRLPLIGIKGRPGRPTITLRITQAQLAS